MTSRLTLFLVFLAVAFPALAQSPPQLVLQFDGTNAQLSVTADSGSPLTFQHTTNLAPGTWQFLTNFTLASSPALVDNSAPVFTRIFYRAFIVVPTNVAWQAPGTFLMGSPTNEVERSINEVLHTVTLTKGFFMSHYPVTQAGYLSLMNTNPSWFNTNNGFAQDLARPVEQVSWADATNYCAQFTQQERAAGRIFTNWTYRLPTEAEWEFACRAGTSTPFYSGSNLLSGMANFNGRQEYIGGTGTVFNTNGVSLGRTTAVGSYPPNGAGLYDMAGNVLEWCQDWFGNFTTNSVIDPLGPGTGMVRVLRGGALNSTGRDCRSAARASSNPALGANTIGFRMVLVGP